MQKIQSNILGEIVSSNSAEAYFLHKKSHFGEKVGETIQYSFSEALFLVEKKKMDIFSRNKKISEKELLRKFQKFDKKIQIKYPVFKDLRKKGYGFLTNFLDVKAFMYIRAIFLLSPLNFIVELIEE